ncbi:MAG: SDR family NAD(P)-dependent oxidoreductase [Alistipes finegoldii]
MPFPGLALYSASKAYMRSFSVAFAKEVRDRGIRVTAVCPAGVATDLYGLTPRWQRIGKRLGVLITPDNCARRGLRALWRGRRCIVPDWWNRAWIPLQSVADVGAAADPQVHDAIPEITRPAVCHDRKPSGSRNDGLNGWRNSRCNGRQNGGRNGRPCKNKNHNSL